MPIMSMAFSIKKTDHLFLAVSSLFPLANVIILMTLLTQGDFLFFIVQNIIIIHKCSSGILRILPAFKRKSPDLRLAQSGPYAWSETLSMNGADFLFQFLFVLIRFRNMTVFFRHGHHAVIQFL